MNKGKWDALFKGHITNIPKGSKIVYYKNPNECNLYHFERVNPTHIGILWGRRKNKSRNWIQIGKVFISNCCMGLIHITKEIQQVLLYLVEHLDIAMCVYAILLGLMFYAVVLNIPFIEGLILCIRKS